jgi:hypothetical protein
MRKATLTINQLCRCIRATTQKSGLRNVAALAEGGFAYSSAWSRGQEGRAQGPHLHCATGSFCEMKHTSVDFQKRTV